MGHTIAVSRTPPPGLPADPGRARPGQPRRVLCRYLRRGANGQCTAEALNPDAEVVLCSRHTALVIEDFQTALNQLTDRPDIG